MTELTKKPAKKKAAPAKPRVHKTVKKPASHHVVKHETESDATVKAAPAKPIHRTYTFAVGRRKSAIARVRFTLKGTGLFIVNGREVKAYFPTFELQKIVHDPVELTKFGESADISVKVGGGGTHGQAEAVRLGISRVLVKLEPDLRTTLKRAGFMRRDPRVKERKKYGLKRARRAPQWQKR